MDKSLAARLACIVIALYRGTLGALWGPVCRFTPSCSEYAETCYLNFGWWEASRKVFHRLLHCHPFHEGGFDPV